MYVCCYLCFRSWSLKAIPDNQTIFCSRREPTTLVYIFRQTSLEISTTLKCIFNWKKKPPTHKKSTFEKIFFILKYGFCSVKNDDEKTQTQRNQISTKRFLIEFGLQNKNIAFVSIRDKNDSWFWIFS